MARSHDVVIIGAGPYGLAATAHLRARGIEPQVYGEPMEFWHKMTGGLWLRSGWHASHISDPAEALTLDAFVQSRGNAPARLVPLADFISYGHWFQKQAVPNLDTRRVNRVEKAPGGFWLDLSDGERVQAQRVVVAGGIAPFANRPADFQHLPSSLASHTSQHADMAEFSGRKLVVLGAGQSALESALLASECGAEVELIARREIIWLRRRGRKHMTAGALAFIDPPTDVGPFGLSWLVAQPELFQRLPRHWQDRIACRCIRPAGAAWLRPRLTNVRMTIGRRVVSATPAGAGMELLLDDGTRRSVDHVILGTGYRINVKAYPFLGPQLAQSIDTVQGYPELSAGFESSVSGLHFLGAPAARSFGPLMRFVTGTSYAAPALAKHLQANQASTGKRGNA
jgi:FAD-dependent urate hydroxylase